MCQLTHHWHKINSIIYSAFCMQLFFPVLTNQMFSVYHMKWKVSPFNDSSKYFTLVTFNLRSKEHYYYYYCEERKLQVNWKEHELNVNMYEWMHIYKGSVSLEKLLFISSQHFLTPSSGKEKRKKERTVLVMAFDRLPLFRFCVMLALTSKSNLWRLSTSNSNIPLL